jgi:hypothetical protein
MLAGGEHVIGPVLPELHGTLCAHDGWSDVQVEIVAGGRHYLVEERHAETAPSAIRGRRLDLTKDSPHEVGL